ncbi:MAG: hypothetical protein HY791_29675 [Deltaproteobacteria bacterium]|nr:hypothetical protein [Deltaproteobacteria bacterium]
MSPREMGQVRRLGAMAVCVWASVCVSSRTEATPTRVGLVVNLRVNVDEQRGDELAAALGRALRNREKVDVVAGAEVTRRLQPEGVPEDCVANQECVNRIGDRLDADELLFLVLVKIGDTIQVDATWASRGGSRTLSRDQIVLDNSPDDESFQKAASGLLPPMQRKAAVAAPSEGAPTTKRKVTVVETAPNAPGPVPVAIAGGVAILALAGGIGLAVTTRDDYEAALDLGCDQRTCGGGDAEKLDVLGQRGLVTNVLFATAAVAGLTALFLHVANNDAPVTARSVKIAAIEPSITSIGLASVSDGLALSVGGTL